MCKPFRSIFKHVPHNVPACVRLNCGPLAGFKTRCLSPSSGNSDDGSGAHPPGWRGERAFPGGARSSPPGSLSYDADRPYVHRPALPEVLALHHDHDEPDMPIPGLARDEFSVLSILESNMQRNMQQQQVLLQQQEQQQQHQIQQQQHHVGIRQEVNMHGPSSTISTAPTPGMEQVRLQQIQTAFLLWLPCGYESLVATRFAKGFRTQHGSFLHFVGKGLR